jgi:hypothetical protein
MILKTKDIKSNLCKKGFIEDNKDRKYFLFSLQGETCRNMDKIQPFGMKPMTI